LDGHSRPAKDGSSAENVAIIEYNVHELNVSRGTNRGSAGW
jgi:hypothetical protein